MIYFLNNSLTIKLCFKHHEILRDISQLSIENEFFFSVLYNASFDGYGNCVASKCTNGSGKKVAEKCESLQIPMCGL